MSRLLDAISAVFTAAFLSLVFWGILLTTQAARADEPLDPSACATCDNLSNCPCFYEPCTKHTYCPCECVFTGEFYCDGLAPVYECTAP